MEQDLLSQDYRVRDPGTGLFLYDLEVDADGPGYLLKTGIGEQAVGLAKDRHFRLLQQSGLQRLAYDPEGRVIFRERQDPLTD